MKRNQVAIAINGLVVCYSADWTRLKTVEVLCRAAYPESEVIATNNPRELMRLLPRLKPRCLMMDLTARNAVGLLCSVRRLHQTIPMLIIQDRVRVSDEAVAEYLGRAVMVESAGVVPDVLRRRLCAGYSQAAVMPVSGCALHGSREAESDMDVILAEIDLYLYRRLAARVPSSRLREDARRLFAAGEPVQHLVRREGITAKFVYQRRAMLCRLLETRPRELSSVLTVAWGESVSPGVYC